MAATKAELLGNDIVNYVRDSKLGLMTDGWRDMQLAGSLIQEFGDSYKDDAALDTWFRANDKAVSATYIETCKENGIEVKSPESIEYRIVLFPIGKTETATGVWDHSVWVRDHGNVEAWRYLENAIGDEVTSDLQYYSRGGNVGRPMVNWELMAFSRLTNQKASEIALREGAANLLLDTHIGRSITTMTTNALTVDRSEGLYA
tara:strand:+ start:1253 stop:1861 length:609 start_codon:yes stop_codon:yes gene_type:complete